MSHSNITFVPQSWMVVPFVLLLLLIAAGPLLLSAVWHKWYRSVSVCLGLLVAGVYFLGYGQPAVVAETFAEYVSFISLLLALYVAAGGIYIFADFESKASTNIVFLLCGAVLANIIGTTGASILLIRPFMRLNRYRLKPYHIVFFIFLVSNLGGLLTPIGDPPLFMGFLKGVPFSWPMFQLFRHWIMAMLLLSVLFFFFEKRNTALDEVDTSANYTRRIRISGKRNFVWLALIIITVFLDPNIIEGFPAIELHGRKISFIRELFQLGIAYACIRGANKNAMERNDFTYEPIREVAFLFFGIFLTMIPALQLLGSLGTSSAGFTPGMIYMGTGIFSAILDNAPTYLNFLTVVLSSSGYSISSPQDIIAFIQSDKAIFLEAVSVGAVFWGAMTYIGNGPNLMVKAIAESSGVKMPGFFAYIYRFALPLLLPVLLLAWLLFFF